MYSLSERKHEGKLIISDGIVLIEEKNSTLSFKLDTLISLTMKTEQEAYSQDMCCDIERVKYTSPEWKDFIRISFLTKDFSSTITLKRDEADKLYNSIHKTDIDVIEEYAKAHPELKIPIRKKFKRRSDHYPFHIHYSLASEVEEKPLPKMSAEESKKQHEEWLKKLREPFIGTCDLCKGISALDRKADERFLLCEKCSSDVTKSLKDKQITKCAYCEFSPKISNLLGEIQENGKFKCLMCLPDGVCSNCEKTKRLVGMARNYHGFQVLCADCS